MDQTALADEALEHLRALLRFDTTNPPGNELGAARYLAEVLQREGIEPTVIESAPGRGNLVARLRGDGSGGGALLLLSHLDVVAAEPEKWSHPPFGAELAGGYLYGRGAVDMKQMTAMSLAALLRLKRSAVSLRRDVIFAAVADEEAGGQAGAGFLAQHHPDMLRAEYALCEVGGYFTQVRNKTYLLVQVAERGCAWCRARFRGEPGHGTFPNPDSAVARMTRALGRLQAHGLPLHPTEPVRRFIELVSTGQSAPVRLALRALLHPLSSQAARSLLDAEQVRLLGSQLHNTAVPTQLRAGDSPNVVPSEAEVVLDGRVLPGQTWETFRDELQVAFGEPVELELLRWAEPLVYPADTPLFDLIRRVVVEREPGVEVVPYLMPGFTDAKHLHPLGVVTYGFAPQKNDPSEKVPRLYHGHDERIGVVAFRWGVEVLGEVVERFCRSVSAAQVAGQLMGLEPPPAAE